MTRQTVTAIVSVAVCYGVCAGFSLVQAWQANLAALESVAFDLAVPGLAGLSFLLLATTLGSLVPDARISFPLNLTVPSVYVALMGVWASLLGTMRNSMVALPEPLVAATTWAHPERWVPTLVGQIVALTLCVLASSSRMRR